MAGRRTLLTTLSVVLLQIILLQDGAYAEKDFYGALGLERDASDKQIKRAFRKLSLKYHPDKNPGNEEAKQKYLLISEAYDCLSDPEKRQVYDIHGEEGLKKHGQNQGQQMNPFGGLFGGGGGGMRKGQPFQIKLEVDLDELYLGGQKALNVRRKVVCKKCRGTGAKGGETRVCKACKGQGTVMTVQQLGPGFNIQMQKPCDKCNGKGRSFKHKCEVCGGNKVVEEGKELVAVLEKGMPDGHEIVFERASEQTPDTIPGDVIMKLATRPHPRFKRRGNDLLFKMNISLKDALLGFTRHITHMDGRKVEVKRKGVTYPEQKMKLKGEGMPVHNYPSEKGIMEITFTIDFPKKLTEAQQEGIKKLLS